MNAIQAIILAIIEGITEFLPISSTGHMIIANAVMGLTDNDFAKVYIIVIQLGAILSVVVLYWKRFFAFDNFNHTLEFYMKLIVAFIPALIAALLLGKLINSMLGNVKVVAISLLVGGIFMLFVDRIFKKTEEGPDRNITYRMALMIGIFQVIALIPGVSRSAATIIGGLSQNLNRKQAAEFSFFLAVPTMFAATSKDLYDNRNLLTQLEVFTLIGGCVVAFVVAIIAIRTFIGYLTKHGFKVFGYYRIILGAAILILLAMGYSLNMVE